MRDALAAFVVVLLLACVASLAILSARNRDREEMQWYRRARVESKLCRLLCTDHGEMLGVVHNRDTASFCNCVDGTTFAMGEEML